MTLAYIFVMVLLLLLGILGAILAQTARLGRIEKELGLVKQCLIKLPPETGRFPVQAKQKEKPSAASVQAPPQVSRTKNETPLRPEASQTKAARPPSGPSPAPTTLERYLEYKQKWQPAPVPGESTTEPARSPEPAAPSPARARYGIEQWLGLRGALIAGIITSLIGAGLFLKYIYDQSYMGPVGRIALTAGSGLLCIGIGEFSRRRRFGLAAQGLTALGFALLFAADFTANHFYQLLGTTSAFALAVMITVAAMSYAVYLKDPLAAFTALLGGYLTPILLQSGAGGSALFVYTALLSGGALACAWYRNWRVIHWQALIGTYLLYSLWVVRVPVRPGEPASQLAAAILWLGVFFVIFAIMPVLYELAGRCRSGWSDGLAQMFNASVAFSFYYYLLTPENRPWLAGVCAVLFGAHLALRWAIRRRQPDDSPLQEVLLLIALGAAVMAVPMYFGLYTSLMAWSLQGAIILYAGRRYANRLCEAAALLLGLVLLLALAHAWPLHDRAFTVFFNRPYLSAVSVLTGCYLYHWIYRRLGSGFAGCAKRLETLTWFAAWSGLLVVTLAEWSSGCRYNPDLSVTVSRVWTCQGRQLIVALFLVLLAAWPIRPRGAKLDLVAVVMALVFAVSGLYWSHSLYESILIRHHPVELATGALFVNWRFLSALTVPAAVFGCAALIRRQGTAARSARLAGVAALAGVLTLWALLTLELRFHFQFTGLQSGNPDRGRFLAQTAISIAWAVYSIALMITGFWKHLRPARYTALAILVLTLIKVFLLDMAHLAQVYRIAGVVVLGGILLAVAFLYQYARNQGLWDQMDN